MRSQYIVCKIKENGVIIAGTPPMVHLDYTAAKIEAERLAATIPDAKGFLIMKAVAKSERVPVSTPVRTVPL